MADLVVAETQKQSRLSFTCEFKLSMVEWYYDNNKNIIRAANKLKIDIKRVRNYITGGKNIRKQKNKRKIVCSRHAQYSLLEDEILDEFREVRNLGKCIKGWWYLLKAKKIIFEKYPAVTNFKYSKCWFNGFWEVFVDGILRVKPEIIFQGALTFLGKHIKAS